VQVSVATAETGSSSSSSNCTLYICHSILKIGTADESHTIFNRLQFYARQT
jgi:hypothetical protein